MSTNSSPCEPGLVWDGETVSKPSPNIVNSARPVTGADSRSDPITPGDMEGGVVPNQSCCDQPIFRRLNMDQCA
eukprot:gene10847-biopygen15759